jgi:hypothetical protein
MNEPEVPRGCTVARSEFKRNQADSRSRNQFRMRIANAAVDRRREIHPREVGYGVSIQRWSRVHCIIHICW